VLGNHDIFPISEYQKYFTKIHGLTKYKGFWLSHAPIHSEELRGKINIHGHVHNKIIVDPRYRSVCVEALNGKPISLSSLRIEYAKNF
jgi:calcineurin-like phosphoesterase family protein